MKCQLHRPAVIAFLIFGAMAVSGSAFAADNKRLFEVGVRGATVTSQDVADLASATRQALDSDPIQRDAPTASAAYATQIQVKFNQVRPPSADKIGASLEATTDPDLLADPAFAANLRALFLAQAADSLAPAQIDNNRVIGGSPIAAKDVLSIVDTSDGVAGQVCSGILLNSTHVLTAGHCVCLGVNKRVKTGPTVFGADGNAAFLVADSELLPGMHCPAFPKDADDAEKEQLVGMALQGHDLAVLHLRRQVNPRLADQDKLLGPTAFAQWRTASQSRFVRVGGFGLSIYWAGIGVDPGSFGVLNFADLAIPSTSCRPPDVAKFGCVASLDLVAGTNPNMNVRLHSAINAGTAVDTCSGDSGGPAYAQISTAAGAQFFPVAITSRATKVGKCGAGSIYTLLDSDDVRRWLKGNGATFTE
jgi:hypothetical protein